MSDREGAKPSSIDDALFVLLVKPGYGKPVLVEASKRDFPNFGGISCEPCAYTKTTLERGPLKLTTAYGFGGSSMASIDRVGGGIYPQTAAVGTANVGKFIKPILKDHLRHSVVIADNVGANVGCIASTCRSYAIPSGGTLIVTAILHDPYHMLGLVYNAFGNKKISTGCYITAAFFSPKDSSLWKSLENVCLPDVNHLVLSAVVSCVEIGSDLDVWNSNVFGFGC
ncbi:hypothetical protein Nepgr_030467 [Nepenthes gracilis]|uniref:H(+)-exporting diphosphatase n=1 Tax=Nepenthes gracilis TaxID=150966 RepID=A0AAD3TGC5_NEPGR|nr:hypothetical protein Nepgr_030467 [Nepenthes gracilis]